MAAILVTDGEQRAALAVVRSLGAAGHRVHTCSALPRSLAGSSRHSRSDVTVPDPLREPQRFAEAVAERCRSCGAEVLLPISEPSLLAVLKARELVDALIPFPALPVFRAISDKANVLETAADLGIAVPRQLLVRSSEAGSAVDVQELSYPVVLKPGRSVGAAGGEQRKVGVRYAPDPAALTERMTDLPKQAFPLLLQERVIGPGVGIFLLRWKGEWIARFSHRRIREKPPSGGVSVYRESIGADPRLLQLSQRLLEAFEWQGVAMVEYKIEAATGVPYLMEVNGRFWGSLQLAVDAGVDFPRLLVECALGGKPEPVSDYRSGVRSRWWWGDVDHLLACWRGSASRNGQPQATPGRLRALRDFLTLWSPGDRSEIFRTTDPLPALRETVDWVRGR